ncbi:secreted frizzled-related protein 1 isoform X2 [Columba livia]|uniref:secreted frizzled-related protein 1 isoform X2 n=1 Tax=Columba livia TaxID=8932 RepID=UPI0031BAC983
MCPVPESAMQTQTCSACRRAALSAGDGFPPLLQIRCAGSPEFSAGVSDREKHQQELGAAASRERAPRAGAAGWSAQGLRSLRGDAGVARPRAPGWGQLSCRRGWPGGSAAGGSLRYLSPRRWARSEPRCCPAGGQALGREIESDRRLVISLCCCMSSPCSGTVTQWGTEAKPEAFTALVERLETLTCPQTLKMTIKEVKKENGDKMIIPRKRKALKLGPIRKKNLKKLVLFLKNGADCPCHQLDSLGHHFLIMGRQVKTQYLLTAIYKWDKKNKEFKKFMKKMKSPDCPTFPSVFK